MSLGREIGEFAGKLIEPVTDLISEAITDKDKAAELAHEIATLAGKQAHAERLAQINVNNTEAQHSSVFVSGWRPAAGWFCVLSLAWAGVGVSIANFIASLIGSEAKATSPDTSDVVFLLGGMLGLVVTRGYEKAKGVARK